MTPFDHLPPASPQSEEANSRDARRGGHSGSEKRQRGVPFSIRLLPEERAAIEQNASTVGLSLGSYARACMLISPGPRARRKPHVNALELAKATAALNKSGNVLNQIAHVLNAGGAITLAHECFAAIAENRAAAAAIRAAVGRKNRDDSQGHPTR